MEVRRALNQKLILTDFKIETSYKTMPQNETAKIIDADQDYYLFIIFDRHWMSYIWFIFSNLEESNHLIAN